MSMLRAAALSLLIAAGAQDARAELMQLGVQDFGDGQILGCYSPSAGPPPCSFGWTSPTDPFNRFLGSDPSELNPNTVDFSGQWTFDLSGLGPQLPGSVRIEVGLYDHDSAASGEQLDFFVLNPGTAGAHDLSSLFSGALEAAAGIQAEYNVVGIDLPQAALASLFSGSSATFALALQGPAWIKEQLGVVEAQGSNGAGLDFARLTLTYGATAPEPASALLLGLAFAAIAAARGRRR